MDIMLSVPVFNPALAKAASIKALFFAFQNVSLAGPISLRNEGRRNGGLLHVLQLASLSDLACKCRKYVL